MTDIPEAVPPRLRLAVSIRPLVLPALALLTGVAAQVPVAAPLALLPLQGGEELGRITAGMPQHAVYAAILKRAVDEDFARLLMPAAPALP